MSGRAATDRPERDGPSQPEVLPAPVLLRAAGLHKAFVGQVVLDGLDLELRQGEVVLLRGENGSGKTTLLNILTGNLEPDAGTIQYLADNTPRTYRFPRRWWEELNPFDHFTPEFVAREGVGRTWQDVRLFGAQSVRDNIAVAEPGHPGENPLLALLAPGLSARKEAQLNLQADAILARLGLATREESSADRISLGQSKRVAIARAFAAGARILFLDEPLAGLDRQGVVDVVRLLATLVADHEVTLVIVEHIFNQPHLRDVVTTDWLLENGRLSRNGRGVGHFGRPEERGGRPAWFHLLATDDAEIIDEPLPRGALLTRIRRADRVTRPPVPVLEIRDLVVKRGARSVIGLDEDGTEAGFNLTLFEGEIAVLQAPNGWGKSTLVAAMAGLTPIARGTARAGGRLLNDVQPWVRSNLGLVALLSGGHRFKSLTVRDVLMLGRGSRGRSVELDPQRRCGSLSGGESQRLACAALPGGLVRLFDEPFAGLDRMGQLTIAAMVQQFSSLVLVPSAHGLAPAGRRDDDAAG